MNLTAHFHLSEFASRDGVLVPPDLIPNVKALATELEVLRAYLNRPIVIRSGYRSPARNAAVKGAPKSQHLLAKAADIVVHGIPPEGVAKAVEHLIAAGQMKDGGVGVYRNWVHYDVRSKRARWRG